MVFDDDEGELRLTTKNSAILHTYFATVWSTVDFFYMDNNFATFIGVTNI